MKKLLLGFIVAVTAMVMMTVGVLADTATVNGIIWTYTVSGGEASIGNDWDSAIPSTTTGAITIPSSLGGYPVTSIGEYAFYCCDGLTSITIPDSVTSIGDYAFYCCDGLTITIPDSVTCIGGCAFFACEDPAKFIVDSNNPIYKSVNGLLLTKDGETLIAGINGNVVIPQGVTSIGDYAFYYYDGLTSITIPDSVTSIGAWAFYYCSGLTKFIVDSNNPIYKSVNGLLLTKDGETLIAGINGNVVIPDSVTSIGDGAFLGYSGLTSVTIPNSVTSIGNSAFSYCSGLTSITIPNSVTSIGDHAFSYCSGLTCITIPNSVTSIGKDAFSGCSGLTKFIVDSDNPNYKSVNGLLLSKDGKTLIAGINGNVVIPDSVTSIGGNAFYHCSGLTSVTIPNSVTSIGGNAFYHCSGLTSITIGNSVTSIGEWAFYNCSGLTSITIGNSVTSIGEWAFYNCSGLTSVTIPDSVTSIGDYAFYYCSGLTSVTIPQGVTSIGDYAFNCCSGLTSITIPDSVTNIGSSAFSGCHDSLFDTTTIPGVEVVDGWVVGYTDSCPSVLDLTGIRGIGAFAFYYCSGLTSVTIPDSVTNIGEVAFEGCCDLIKFIVDSNNPNYKSVNGLLLSKDGKTLIAGVNGDITIPDSVTSIGDGAFNGCSGLTSVTIPDSVTNIGEVAFNGCSGLTSITIPDNVTSIGDWAFAWCWGLTSITIPNSVTSIGEYAFNGCSGLTEAIFLGDAPRYVGDDIFYNSADDFTIKVKEGTKGWNGDLNSTELLETWYGYPITYDTEDEVLGIMTELVDGMEWKYRVVNGEAEIYGGDWTSAIPETTIGAITIPSTLGGYPVTSIGEYAFYHCSALTSITIPDSVTSIGDYAFSGCYSLTSVTIPDSVTSIGEGTFAGCEGLTSVTIPNSVTSIGDYAFQNCWALTSVTIPNSVTSIGYGAFSDCWSLTSVTIPDSVTSIGEDAFKGCSDLIKFIVDSNNPNYKSVNGLLLSKDGKTLIAGINGDVVIPDGVTSIGSYAFEDYGGLTSVTIPDSVTSIGEYVFNGCSGLIKFIVDSNNPNYKSVNSLLLTKDGKILIHGVNGDVVIPDSVTSIGDSAFWNCWGLTSVTIPDSVTSIGEYAFRNCCTLTSVTIPDSVTSIGEFAFYCCSLTSVTIGDSVTSIGEGAFNECYDLKSAIFLGDAPRDVGDYIFDYCADDFVIKVKKGTKGWNGDYTSTELPEAWYGYPIEYDSEDDLYPVLDANATAEDVANVLSGSVDENLAKNITSVEMYNNYREWALSVKNASGDEVAGVEAVKASTTAWMSFALDQSRLIANEPVEGDIAIASLDVVAADGSFEFTVNIDKIDVGDGAVEENLKKLFKIEGATSLGNDANFSSENVEIELAEPVNGDVKFKILPKDSPDSFFIRAKLLK